MPAKLSHIRNFIFILAITFLFAGSCLLAAEKGSDSGGPRYRVFAFKHISVEQAKKYLADARLGTVSQLPTTNMILVTASPRQLVKASAILKIVDSERPYVMKSICPASAASDLPLNEQIAAAMGDNILIGTFSSPPHGADKTKVIIDIHDGSVVAIAPAALLDRIVETIERYGSIKQPQKSEAEVLPEIQPVESSEPNQKEAKKDLISEAELERAKAELEKVKSELNHRNGSAKSGQGGIDANQAESKGLFDNLLDSLAEAEQKMAELTKPISGKPEPNEPAAEALKEVEKPEPNEPAAEPNAVVAAPEENGYRAWKGSRETGAC
jgi:hypothetical protein